MLKHTRKRIPYCLVVFSLWVALPTAATDVPGYLDRLLKQLPHQAAPQLILPADNERPDIRVSGAGTSQSHEWLPVEHPLFTQFLRVHTKQGSANPWAVTLHSDNNSQPVQKGEWVLASLYLRAAPGTGEAKVLGYVERNEPEWHSIADVSTNVTEQWTQVVALGRAETDYPKGSLGLSLHLALGAQTLDVAGVAILRLAPDTATEQLPVTALRYNGMDQNAPWRATAEKMITQNRTGSITLQLSNADGAPLSQQDVVIEQLDHDYQFGTFINPLLLQKTSEAERYRHWLTEYFNVATTPIYWADWGWANPERRADYEAMASYLQHNNIPTRGHVLLYPGFGFSPQELVALKDDRAAFIARVNKHIDEVIPFLKRYGIKELDVINELRHEKDWTDIVGLDTVADWYKRVHAQYPEAVLYINENSILTDGGDNQFQQDHYYQTIKTLRALGAPIHGIGLQGHFSSLVTPPDKLWPILDRFAEFGLPLRITEYDLSTRDQAGQAQYDRDFYTAVFAHPATVGITRWGFYEPTMWQPLGALMGADGHAKPNALAQQKLVKSRWHTRLEGQTDAAGKVTLDGFYGRYQITYMVDGVTQVKEFSLTRKATLAH
ncbi:endo-1,4-beta-xylanase [Gilvimarinus agarilyticus]|uniref:endo-1,4-beta-xylanase n=1 Tax=Gilvimarinus agarilyticus TaxID=679259 RepID=UPI0018DCAC1E|nr:endo-1,4-beta-xylanase [Gilvimarinus agarilyticus]